RASARAFRRRRCGPSCQSPSTVRPYDARKDADNKQSSFAGPRAGATSGSVDELYRIGCGAESARKGPRSALRGPLSCRLHRLRRKRQTLLAERSRFALICLETFLSQQEEL